MTVLWLTHVIGATYISCFKNNIQAVYMHMKIMNGVQKVS